MRIVVDASGESKSAKKPKDKPIEKPTPSKPKQDTPTKGTVKVGSQPTAPKKPTTAGATQQYEIPDDSKSYRQTTTENPPNHEFNHPVYEVDESKIQNEESVAEDSNDEVEPAVESPTQPAVQHKKAALNTQRKPTSPPAPKVPAEIEDDEEPPKKSKKKGKKEKPPKPSKAERKAAKKNKKRKQEDDGFESSDDFEEVVKKPSFLSSLFSVFLTLLLAAIFGVAGYQSASVVFDYFMKSMIGG